MMKFSCQQCRTRYRIDEKRRPDQQKFRVKCLHCGTVICIDAASELSEIQRNWPDLLPDGILFGDRLRQEVIGNFKALHPMAHIVMKVRAIAAKPEADLSEIINLIKTDQAIAVRLLKVANSSYFGLRGKVSSIQHAAAILGLDTLVQVVTLVGNSKLLQGNLPGYGFDSATLWRHSLTVAAGSGIIAKKLAPIFAFEAFMAGLLHDAGKMILDPYILERKAAFTALLKGSDEPPLISERKVMGLDHADVGSELCKHWHLPDMVADAIQRHHAFSPTQGKMLPKIVSAADAIANTVHKVCGKNGTGPDLDSVLAFLGIHEKQLESMTRMILEDVDALEETTL